MEITVHGEKTAKFSEVATKTTHKNMCLRLQVSLVWKLEEQGIQSGFSTGSPILSPLLMAETWVGGLSLGGM